MDEEAAFAELRKLRHISSNIEDYHFTIKHQAKNYRVVKTDKQVEIDAPTAHDLMRGYNYALGLISHQENGQETSAKHFTVLAGMIDLARNGVMNISYLKKYICQLAGLGYSEIWLYLEDEFEIPGEPYFGMGRGRYSQKELHDLALYADQFGLILIPAVQTLAHLYHVIKWARFGQIGDTPDSLYPAGEQAKLFIYKELKAATQPFLTNRVHVGMDEAHNIGLGRYYYQHLGQVIDQKELMKKHVQMVLQICEELKLQPMMWSDMLFEIGSAKHQLYDPESDLKAFKISPKIGQVYWEYHSLDKNRYLRLMKRHFELTDNIYFAAAVWTSGRLAPNQSKMMATMKIGMQAAKEAGIKKVCATYWADDGAEVPFGAAFLGWQIFSDFYYLDNPDSETIKKNFKLLQDKDYNRFFLLDKFDNLFTGINKTNSLPSKILLYEDLMQPRYYQNMKNTDFAKHYGHLAKKLSTFTENNLLFSYYKILALTLQDKSALMKSLSEDSLKRELALSQIEDYQKDLAHLLHLRRKLWFKECKPFGWEIMDLRLGGLLQRAKTVELLVKTGKYQMYKAEKPMDPHINGPFGFARYYEIISPSDISW